MIRILSSVTLLRLAVAMTALIFVGACSKDTDPGPTTLSPESPDQSTPRVLALGDSYTLGEAIPPALSWPQQLADSLAAAGDTLAALDIVAQTGWTSADLRDAVSSGTFPETHDLVTLQIGANDLFAERAIDLFAADFAALADTALTLAAANSCGVLILSIPDYGVTPIGRMFGTDRIRAETDRFNAAARGIASALGVGFVDITDLSRLAEGEPSLVARDGIHYSADMYRLWVGRILPAVCAALGR